MNGIKECCEPMNRTPMKETISDAILRDADRAIDIIYSNLLKVRSIREKTLGCFPEPTCETCKENEPNGYAESMARKIAAIISLSNEISEEASKLERFI